MKTSRFRLPDYHRLRSTIPDHSTIPTFYHSTPGQADQIQTLPQPHTRNARRLSHAHGLAPSPFAHHYSGNHYCFLFLRVLRCFTSPRYHQPPYTFRWRQHPMTGARFPHSETPGSTLGCQLPGAYRRLPRPSSAPDAKASTVCPKKLEHKETQRCSRSLCSSQNTNRTNPQPPPSHRQPRNNLRDKRCGMAARPACPPEPSPPTRQERALSGPKNRRPEQAPVSSGPNSVPTTPNQTRPGVPTPRTWAVLTRPDRPAS
jgi:hypothetical protein